MINFTTRTNEGQVHDHFADLQSALDYFISDSGYRLDFHLPDGQILYVYRGEYGEDIPESKVSHPAFTNFSEALGKILLYNPNSKPQHVTSNVIPLFN